MMNKNNYKAFYTLLYIVTVSLLMVAIDVHAHDLRFNVTRLSAKDGLSCNIIPHKNTSLLYFDYSRNDS